MENEPKPENGKKLAKNLENGLGPKWGKTGPKMANGVISLFCCCFGRFFPHFGPRAIFYFLSHFFAIFGIRPVFDSITRRLTRSLFKQCLTDSLRVPRERLAFGNREWGGSKNPEGPARQIDVSRQKLSPHCLEAIFDSQLPSPKLSPKMPPKLSLPHKRGLFILFQN